MGKTTIKTALLIIFTVSLCSIITSCSKRINNENIMDDSTLPGDIFSEVIFKTTDGTNYLQVKSGSKKIETTLVLVNLSDYEICWATNYEQPVYHVRLQKFVEGSWQFIDYNPYYNEPVAGAMMSVLPGSLYGKIPVSVDIDTKTLDPDGQYRFYFPIEYRPVRTGTGEQYDISQVKKACVTAEIDIVIVTY